MSHRLNRLRVTGERQYRWVPEERIVEMLVLAGWAYEQNSPVANAQSRQALEAWIEMGLGFASGPEGRRFDPIEVTNFLKWAGLTGRHPYWEERYLTTGRRFVVDLATKNASSPGTGPVFHVSIERTFNLSAVAPGHPLRLRLPLPLEGHHLRDLKVEASASRAVDRISVHPGRLEVRATAGHDANLTVGAKLRFSAERQEPAADAVPAPADLDLYLRNREGLVAVSPRVRELSAELSGVGTGAAQALRNYWEYINRELVCGAVHYDQVDPEAPGDWVLNSGWFDCQLGAALFVSLCRARGIPARVKGGRVLYPLAPADHFWAEAWLEGAGWTPFDFLSWDLSRGGRDEAWRDYFFGRLDQRMTTECLPREFTGSIGVPIPRAWMLLQRGRDGGLETTMAGDTGDVIYSDLVRVEA